MFETPDDVFAWLRTASGDTTYYLALLNLHWGHLEFEQGIAIFRELARQLKPYPEVVSLLIQNTNWRFAIVGNAVAILQRDPQFEEDLYHRLKNAWIAPQLAVGLAMLSTGKFIPALEARLGQELEEEVYKYYPDGKDLMSLYYCLKQMGSGKASAFAASDLFQEITPSPGTSLTTTNWRYLDNHLFLEIADKQWQFWNSVSPI